MTSDEPGAVLTAEEVRVIRSYWIGAGTISEEEISHLLDSCDCLRSERDAALRLAEERAGVIRATLGAFYDPKQNGDLTDPATREMRDFWFIELYDELCSALAAAQITTNAS